MATSRIITRDTRDAGDEIERLVRQAGVGADLPAIRLRVLKDDYSRADVDVTTRRMLRVYCEVVWADQGNADNDRKEALVQAAERYLTRAIDGPSVVARTNSRIRSSRDRVDGRTVLVMARVNEPARWWLTAAPTEKILPPTEDEFLRNTPSFINDSNKYFVIVGSADSEKNAVQFMNRLKVKSPKYDFVVFGPYGTNHFYSVMMATWVSREVAKYALQEALAFAPDAIIWACRSTGDAC